MKKSSLVFLLFILINISTTSLFAQDRCPGSYKEFYLNSNNIRASFFPRGNKFTTGDQGSFLAPYPSNGRLSTIFASSPWVGGFDDAGNLKIAYEKYPPANPEEGHYSVGPLSPIGILYDTICTHYDKAWSVYAEDIEAHRIDFYTDFKIDDTIASIFQWPARGNKHFKRYYGFDLPFDNLGLAPFNDSNSNDIYDPENGDYPLVFPHQTSVIIPDQILWMVFNDLSAQDENPLRFEIQLTAFAFHCQENSWLNYTIFNRYRIITRAVTSVDSVFFGFWTDYDLGCHEDDFVGSDSIRNTEFVYNDDNGDGNPGIDCPGGIETYGFNPPVQSMTYLSHPMHSFIAAGNENEPIEFYRKLNGHWNDNTHIYPSGEGYDPGSSLEPTRFLFNGDPRNENSWSANNVLVEGKEYRTVSSVNLGRMDPGAVRDVIVAYQFHHHPDSNYNGQLSLMYNNIDSLLSSYYLGENCSPFPFCTGDDCVWPGDFNNNGIADHIDLLYWGIMKNQTGNPRNGLVSWRGHYADEWNNSTIEGINFKHGDGNGNGFIGHDDLETNVQHFNFTNPDYIHQDKFPEGPEIFMHSWPLTSEGRIPRIHITAGTDITNVLGLAFELDFDTTLFELRGIRIPHCPLDSNIQCLWDINYAPWVPGYHISPKYAFVKTDHAAFDIQQGYLFDRLFGGLYLKDGVSFADLPDTIVLKIKNLIAIDPEGNDLHIGANQLVFYKDDITSVIDLPEEVFSVYPNPADDLFYVEVPFDVKGELINIQGKLLKKFDLTPSGKVNVSDLPHGIYFLKIPRLNRVLKVIIQ